MDPSRDVVYMGDWTTPSGIPIDENAYILNVAQYIPNGGYIDAAAIIFPKMNNPQRKEHWYLDENHNACAHLVNHSKIHANVRVISFYWSEVFPRSPPQNSANSEDRSDALYYRLPNVVRSDGAPRYFDGDTIVYFEKHAEHLTTIQNNTCGAVFYAKNDLPSNQELFLDYQLQYPLPSWAKEWYEE
jgi:hypothetical protein